MLGWCIRVLYKTLLYLKKRTLKETRSSKLSENQNLRIICGDRKFVVQGARLKVGRTSQNDIQIGKFVLYV